MRFLINNEKEISIKFHHENNTNDSCEMKLDKGTYKAKIKPSYTICTIQYEGKEYIGKAQLHKGDNFNKTEGRKRALKRVLKLGEFIDSKTFLYNFQKEQRAEIWKNYFSQCKIK